MTTMPTRDPRNLGWEMRPTWRARVRAWWRRTFPPPIPAAPEDYTAVLAQANAEGRHLYPVGLHRLAHIAAEQRVRGQQ